MQQVGRSGKRTLLCPCSAICTLAHSCQTRSDMGCYLCVYWTGKPLRPPTGWPPRKCCTFDKPSSRGRRSHTSLQISDSVQIQLSLKSGSVHWSEGTFVYACRTCARRPLVYLMPAPLHSLPLPRFAASRTRYCYKSALIISQ